MLGYHFQQTSGNQNLTESWQSKQRSKQWLGADGFLKSLRLRRGLTTSNSTSRFARGVHRALQDADVIHTMYNGITSTMPFRSVAPIMRI